jgi:hypothetical protein
VGYAVDNALFQWEEGERRLRESDDLERHDLEEAVAVVEDELRRRLGSSFTIGELADLYGAGIDWATDLAQAHMAGTDAAVVADAAFARYARRATNYAGGRPVDRPEPLTD